MFLCSAGAWGAGGDPTSPGGSDLNDKLQEEVDLANAQLSQANMEMDALREELEQQRQQSSEKVARLQKEVDLAKHARDGELASIISVPPQQQGPWR